MPEEMEDAIREAQIVYRFATKRYFVSFTNGYYFTTSDAYKYTKAWDDILFAFYDEELTSKVELYRLGTNPKMLLKGVQEMFDGRKDGDDYRKGLDYGCGWRKDLAEVVGFGRKLGLRPTISDDSRGTPERDMLYPE